MRNNKQATMMIMKGTKPKQLMVKSRAGQSDHMQNITRMNSARKLVCHNYADHLTRQETRKAVIRNVVFASSCIKS